MGGEGLEGFFTVALNEILFGGGTQLGNIRTRRLPVSVRRNRQTQELIHEVITTPRKKSLCSFCLIFHLSSLSCPIFLSLISSVCSVCLLCGFNSKRIGGFGVAGFWTAAACRAADVMGESYRLI